MSRDSIFISYRRDDTAGHVGRLYDNLSAHFDPQQIFMDVDHLEPGEDFLDEIDKAVASCRVLLVVIGKEWLSCTDGTRRRLDNPNDFVRLEVATALEKNIRIIPVLVHGARMPSQEELPDNLAKLARRQAQEIGDGYRWKSDVEALIRAIERIFSVPAAEPTGNDRRAAEAPESRQPQADQPHPSKEGAKPAEEAGRKLLPIEPAARSNYGKIILVGAGVLALMIGIVAFLLLRSRPLERTVSSTDAGAVISALKSAHKPIGIDVQHYRGAIDWAKVKNSGISFAYIKASDGIDFQDPLFAANWKASSDVHILRGAYTVFRPGQDGDLQARAFYDAVKEGQVNFGELPPAVGVKEFQVDEKSIADLRTMLLTINQQFARRPVIYTSSAFWESYSRFGSFAKYPLWVSETHVVQPTTLPSGWSTWTFWQFSQASEVPGISGPVDLDTFNGSAEQLLAYSRGEVSP